MDPEQKARQNNETLLSKCGWAVQDYSRLDPSVSRGIPLRELPLKSGEADYLLLVDRNAVGVIEAKKEGTLLSGVAEQSGHYGDQVPDFMAVQGPLPFLYELTGVETFFRDRRDPAPHLPRTIGTRRTSVFRAARSLWKENDFI